MKKSLRFYEKPFLLLLGAFFTITVNFAQVFDTAPIHIQPNQNLAHSHTEKCAHNLIIQKMEKDMGYFGTKPFFENWIDKKIEVRRNQPRVFSRLNASPRLIPVVVHIIHTGQPEGQGSNIPYDQVLEQIRVLNEDFNRLNADAAQTPAEFASVAGSANIEFVLAKQDPSGLPTDGVLRVKGPKSNYDPDYDATLISSLSRWNANEYLNLYVVSLVNPYIGYASFPVSDLPGLNFPVSSAQNDGVTIDYRYFGVGGSAVTGSQGRTATHEIGHYLGLRHIWGDGGCGVDDFVEDTPEQDNSNNICNSNPSRFSCNSNDMIQNYMDYTPDACMNLFTLGQIERFNVVLANSPRRVSLVNNRATKNPELKNNDLAISRIISPGEFVCDPIIRPEVELLNAGKNTLTSAQVQLLNNGVVVETKLFNFNLSTGEPSNARFGDLQLSLGENNLEFRILKVNNQADSNPNNNTKAITSVIEQPVALPFITDLANFPDPWTIDNPDESITWEKVNLPISGTNQDVLVLKNFEYEAYGQLDYFISPSIDLSKYRNAQLVFEMAYGPYDDKRFEDFIFVAISQDCGNTFDLGNAPYKKSGQQLETSESKIEGFVPTKDSQFRTELVDLRDYADLGKVRLAIVNENGYGNNVFIRNIKILPNADFKYGLVLDELISPTPITTSKNLKEELIVENTGNLRIDTFLFSRTTNSTQKQTFIANGAEIQPQESANVTIEKSTSPGKNKLVYEVSSPNFDQNGSLPSKLTRYTIIDSTIIHAPWRQDFNAQNNLELWKTISPEADASAWQVVSIPGSEQRNNAAVLANITAGNTYWLGSPIFDLSSSRQASVFFDLAAGAVSPTTQLKLYVSSTGGLNYQEVWKATAEQLTTSQSSEANPANSEDYVRHFVDLSEFAGTGTRNVRLAFVLENGVSGDSPIYLDNVELFLNANPNPVIPSEGMGILYPNPAREVFNIAFNLAEAEDVNIQIISSGGAVVQDIDYPRTLNQTYTFSTELFSKGVFIIKITSNSMRETKRVIIN